MLTFRNAIDFVLVAALAVTVVLLVRAHQTSNATGEEALAAVGSPIGDVKRVGFKPPHEHWFPRASTYLGEVAHVNHEGF
jgi:archaellin